MRLESLPCHQSASRRRGEAQSRICSRARPAQPEKVDKVRPQAAEKSKRDIEEWVARLAPKPPVPTVIRKLPERGGQPALTLSPSSVAPPEKARPVIAPLSAETYKVQFTASRGLRDKL